ncbi:MAG: SLC13 family permease [candidate division KSB1 bacterium]|nr:SLC13 family permease [candidate division KSB1 bacterium]
MFDAEEERLLHKGMAKRLCLLAGGVAVFVLILAIPPLQGLSPEGRATLATASLMAWWWVTEVVPIAATSLVPLLLFPLFGVMPLKRVGASYGDPNIFLFMGGFFMAVAMERWGLHRRVALHIVRVVGTSPRRVLLGFMCATAFLSMWISNTATAMLMLPIAMAVIRHVEEFVRQGALEDDAGFKTAMMLGIAYAASIGGIGTLIGTPPNIILVASFRKLFPEAAEVGFAQWLSIGLPLVVLFIPIAWIYLTYVGCKVRLREIPGGRELIEEQLRSLGRMRREEASVLIVFALMAIGWIWRADLHLGSLVIPGWTTLVGLGERVHDATVALGAALLLFLLPGEGSKPLLDWETAGRIPWGILLLFGGGIALADGFAETGLARWIGEHLTRLGDLPGPVMVIVTAALLVVLTEFTSNTAIATIFMPILAATAVAIGENPLLLMIAGTVAVSLAFMLPVATPPNAIVFGSGYVRVSQMLRIGVVLDILGIALVVLLIYSVGIHVFQITPGVLPAWAR